MKNIKDYKKRFYNLLESESGNVKPLLSENYIKDALTEAAYGTCVQNGDTLCAIKCKIKVAMIRCPKSDEVKQIQHALAKKGYFGGEGGGMSKKCAEDVQACDGIFDWRTKKAVTEFQTEFGLTPIDGIVGYDTLTAMEDNGIIDKLQCDCEKQKEQDKIQDDKQKPIRQETEEIEGIGKVECGTLIYCLNYFYKRMTPVSPPNQDTLFTLFDCIRNPKKFGKDKDNRRVDDKTQQCPQYIDCMPKIGGVDPRCTDSSFKKRCIDTFKTKITY